MYSSVAKYLLQSFLQEYLNAYRNSGLAEWVDRIKKHDLSEAGYVHMVLMNDFIPVVLFN